jgi:hypothetical protein
MPDNINDLLELLTANETILRTNSLVEKEISKHGGTVLYSFNNIIIASEISDEFYADLSKNTDYIDYIQELPLKKYGDIDMNLIDQIDVSKIGIDVTVNSGSTGIPVPTSGNESAGSSVVISSGDAPIITNDDLTLTVVANEQFTYKVFATGKLPIKYEIFTKTLGTITISGNTITGIVTSDGIYNIGIKVTNDVGSDIKRLVITSVGKPTITSSLSVTGRTGEVFSYTITDYNISYTYTAFDLPLGLSLSGNIISGILNSTSGIYTFEISIENQYGKDMQDVELRIVGSGSVFEPPVITSAGEAYAQQYTSFNYTITATGTPPISYSVSGALPRKLKFAVDTISGVSDTDGYREVTLKATSPYGTTTKTLRITTTFNGAPQE